MSEWMCDDREESKLPKFDIFFVDDVIFEFLAKFTIKRIH
jgi:hypothetical protein